MNEKTIGDITVELLGQTIGAQAVTIAMLKAELMKVKEKLNDRNDEHQA